MASWLTSSPIAHRGLHSLEPCVPENSLQAFALAVEGGHPIELDVRLTKDNQVVVFHDVWLPRLTGHQGQVKEHTLEALSGLRLLSTQESIPTLKAVLDLVGGRVPLLIELKPSGVPDVLAQVTAEVLDGYKGELAVQSFDPFTVQWFTVNRPQWTRGQLATPHVDPELSWEFRERLYLTDGERHALSNLLLNPVVLPHFIGYDVRYLADNVVLQGVREQGLPVLAWTVNTPERRDTAMQYADGSIFENGMHVNWSLL